MATKQNICPKKEDQQNKNTNPKKETQEKKKRMKWKKKYPYFHHLNKFLTNFFSFQHSQKIMLFYFTCVVSKIHLPSLTFHLPILISIDRYSFLRYNYLKW